MSGHDLTIKIGGEVDLSIADKELKKWMDKKRSIEITANVGPALQQLARVDRALDGILAKAAKLKKL